MESYYQFVDRDGLDRLLKRTWREHMNRCLMDEEEGREFLEFAYDGGEDIGDVLARRTLRWTMERASPQYHFLACIIDATGAGGGPHAACDPFETAVLIAVAVEAMLTRLIDRATLHAVFKINAAGKPSDWLEISEDDEKPLLRGWRAESMACPIYAWQGDDAHLCCGDTALGVADTRRLMRFLTRAWEENWPAPRLTTETLRLVKKEKRRAPRFRHFQLAKDLHNGLKDWRVAKRGSLADCLAVLQTTTSCTPSKEYGILRMNRPAVHRSGFGLVCELRVFVHGRPFQSRYAGEFWCNLHQREPSGRSKKCGWAAGESGDKSHALYNLGIIGASQSYVVTCLAAT